MRTLYTIQTKVTAVREIKEKIHTKGVGKDAEFEEVSLGWFLHLDGSRELIHVGPDKPELKAGDPIRITIEALLST